MLKQAALSRKPTMIDFNFHQIMSWQRAKTMLGANAIGALRHVAVHWHLESRAIQLRMRSWKTLGDDGGGVLGNFISHCFHYLDGSAGRSAGCRRASPDCRMTASWKQPSRWRCNSLKDPWRAYR